MVELFLSHSVLNDDGNDESAKLTLSLLNKLEQIIWSVMISGGRSEARLWLCNAISCVSSISPYQHRDLFVNFLRSKSHREGFATQLLQIFFDKRPQKAGHILAKKTVPEYSTYAGNPRRILKWFSNFSESENKKGAKALSQFAFVNRDICWEELEWKGKHGQSPAMVATKPHYFLDLDVQQTVENFLENVPEFWSSGEFARSLEDGEILFTDTRFFVELFMDLMYKEDSKEIWEAIDEFLMEESFSSLCHHLLIILEEQDLCAFLKLMSKFLNPRVESLDFGDPCLWLEIVLTKCKDWESIDNLLFLNAVVTQGRKLLRLVQDEELLDERENIKDIVFKISTSSSNARGFALIMKECFKTKSINVMKPLGLWSWVLHYRLYEECRTPESWESLFTWNGISFKASNAYELLHDNGSSGDCNFDGSSKTDRLKRKGRSSKKRRRNFDHDDDLNDELLDFNLTNISSSMAKAGSWLLSTDGYAMSWSILYSGQSSSPESSVHAMENVLTSDILDLWLLSQPTSWGQDPPRSKWIQLTRLKCEVGQL
ncbi:hypothetical protein RJ641_031433 [Dillenia turbinata]|uniref:Uncharacterized protein n=1 Tax=Dillenia turbinata TaxID=194707 RepID=A0AAN8VPP5_9MAGN